MLWKFTARWQKKAIQFIIPNAFHKTLEYSVPLFKKNGFIQLLTNKTHTHTKTHQIIRIWINFSTSIIGISEQPTIIWIFIWIDIHHRYQNFTLFYFQWFSWEFHLSQFQTFHCNGNYEKGTLNIVNNGRTSSMNVKSIQKIMFWKLFT